MAISFNDIPEALRQPFVYTEFDPSQADLGLTENPFTVLLVGQMLDAGTADPLQIYRPTSADQAIQWFGQGSQLAQMVEFYLTANPVTKMLAIPVADLDEGVEAQGAISLDGSVSSPAPLYLYIGGQVVRVGASAGQSAASVASAAIAAINADASLSVTASGLGTAIELTAKHKGECGNDIDLRVNYYNETMPGGLSVSFTPMAGGAGNPDPIATIAALPPDQYHVIAWPWTDSASLVAIKDEMDSRWGALRQNDGQAVTVKRGTFGEVLAWNEQNNNRGLSVFASEGSPTSPWSDAAACAGVIAYYANIDPARGFMTLPVPGVLAPRLGDRWPKFPEKNQSLFEGVSSRVVDASGRVAMSNVITTHRKSPLGSATQAYLSINTCFTLSFIRFDWNSFIQNKYARYKLASDADARSFGAGQKIMTPSLARAEAITRFGMWLERGLVEGSAQFKNDIFAEINGTNPNRLDIFMRPNIMNQFNICGTLIAHIV